MADVLRFVDSVSASATTRLDLNDDTAVLHVREVAWNPPRLRRSVSQNVMRDGGYVGPSSYDLRTLVLSFDVIASDVDTLATHLQSLARELDRETNWLMYRPTGATHPVFFKTYRSDITGFDEIPAAVAFRQLTVEVLTDPHAVGLLETINVGAVNNYIGAGSNGGRFDLTGIKGDVKAPLALVGFVPGPNNQGQAFGVRTGAYATSLPAGYECEALAAGTDTSNPGGAADAAMSGTATTNYLRTTFATDADMKTRVTHTENTDATQEALRGTHRVFAVVRRSSATGTINIRVGWGGLIAEGSADGRYNASVATAASTVRQVVDLGVVSFEAPLTTLRPFVSFALQAERTSGTSTLDWDSVIFMPADEHLLVISHESGHSQQPVIDAESESVFAADSATTLYTGAEHWDYRASASGSFLWVTPNTTNRVLCIGWNPATMSTLTGTTWSAVYAYYYPRYTTIRPVST